MAMVEEVYIKIVARAEQAKKELEDVRKATQKAINGPLGDEIKGLKEKVKLREEILKKAKIEQTVEKAYQKMMGNRVLSHKGMVQALEKIKALNEQIIKQNKDLDKNKDIQAADKDFQKKKKQEEILANLMERRKAQVQDYTEFVKRSSSENGRFADRLDKRDRTRSIRENLRRGMEKGSAISEKWHAEENAVYKLERALGIASTAFDRVRHPSEALTDAFYRLQKVGYVMQTALGVIGGTIGDLVGGLLGLVGVAGAAAGSLVAVAGAMANLGAGMMTAKFALAGVGGAVQKLWQGQNQYNRVLAQAKKAFRDLRFEAEDAALSEQEAAIALEKARENLARVQDLPADSRARREAELEYQRADLNYRRAKAKVADANAAVKRGPRVDPSQNPFNNLTKSQIAFAKYLVTLKPLIQGLKEAAASSFLPPLQKSIDVVVKNVFPTLKEGLHQIGNALGDAARNFTDAFKDKGNIKLFADFLKNSQPTIRLLGAVAGKAFGGILVVLKAAQPITDRFARWVFTVADGFEKWAKKGGEDKLKKFFKLAGDVAASLGGAFKLVFGGLSNIVKATFPNGANSGAGGVILNWLKEIGAGFKIFTGSSDFANWLKGATENAKTALGTIGKFLKIFLDMAASPNNQIFWKTIEGAIPFVKKILQDGQKAGSTFATLIVSITKFISLASDAGALNSFFATFTFIVDTVSAFVTAVKPVLDVLGAMHGIFLALVLAGTLFRKGIQIAMGIFMKFLRVVGAGTTIWQDFRAKMVMAGADGEKKFRGVLQVMRELKIEMQNTKRIKLLEEVAKGNKQKQIAVLKDQMSQLNLNTKKGQAEAKKLQTEIDKLNQSYKRLRGELQANAATAKTWGQTVANSAAAAKFGLDKYAMSQDRMAKLGRIGGRVGAGALAIGTAASAMQSGAGGVGAGISAVGAGLSMVPGWGMAAGLGVSIVGSIVSGFEQANAEAKAAEDQKRMEIKAKLVEMQAEKVNNVSTAVGALIGMGRDPAAAALTANAIVSALKKSLPSEIGAANYVDPNTGFTAEAATASLLKSETLQGFVADPKTRAAVIQAATVAAQSKLFNVTDSTGKVTIDPDSITAFLEQTVGDKTGKAATDAIQAYINKTKNKELSVNPETGQAKVLTTVQAQRKKDIEEAIASAKLTAPGQISELNMGLSSASKGMILNPQKYARALGITFDQLMSKNTAELTTLTNQRIAYFNRAMQTGEGFIVPGESQIPAVITHDSVRDSLIPRKNTIPDANEIAFRRAMSAAMKPSNKDELPKPTSTFYTNSLNKSQSMIDILKEIRDNVKPPTNTNQQYGPFAGGVIP